jgi:hypothetical protein
MIKLVQLLVLISLLSSCTYSVTLVHTQGQATDVVDESASNTPSTNLSAEGLLK